MKSMGPLFLSLATTAALMLTLSGCPKGIGIPGAGNLPSTDGIPGTGSSKVDPDGCGNYAASDAGRKLKGFLQATADLEVKVNETVSVLKTSCVMMGTKIQMNPAGLTGETKDVCNKVFAQINDNLKISIKPKAELKIVYKPAVCKIDIKAAAQAAAECEGKAEADMNVRCEGTCDGTCAGACDGKCAGGNAGGKCNGQCTGQCNGRCQGSCEGNAKVDASAECRARAEVKGSIDVECSKPQLSLDADAGIVVDSSKLEMTLGAMRDGLPEIFSIHARLKPLRSAVETWESAAKSLAGAATDIAGSFKDQALCISGQIAAAAKMATNIKAQVNVSVTVTASASGSIGSR
jgi:hypothetical protein